MKSISRRVIGVFAVGAAFAAASVVAPAAANAAAGSATLSLIGPTSVIAGAKFVESAHVVVAGDAINVAEVDLKYPTSNTSFLGADNSGSQFSLLLFNGGGGGTTMFVSGITGTELSGDVLVSNNQFRAGCTPGTATVGYQQSTGVVSPNTGDYVPLTTVPKAITITPAPAGTVCAWPSTGGQGALSRTVTVYGSGFSTGTKVSFGSGVTTKSATVSSSTKLVAKVDVSGAATTGDRSVTVTRANGSKITCSACFTVTAKPAPSSLQPNAVVHGSVVPASIYGTGAVNGAKVAFSGTGVTGTVTAVIPNSRIDLTVSAAATATVGARSVTVTNPDGGRGTCTGCLTIG